MTESKPFVSALIVTRNESDYIETSLYSLINQTYPNEMYEIIVIDGMSKDGTREKVEKIIEKNRDINIRNFDNREHLLAAGWNIGLKKAKGDYVTRIDAHAKAAPDFIEKSVETMMRVSDVVCVGGKLSTESLAGDNGLVSKILSSSFGVGNSSFRVSDKEGYADTAVYGLYKKEIFNRVGYFNEKYQRNQDIELHSRIKACGGKFYFNPDISCVYYSRNSVKKMLTQAYGNGKWNMVLLKEHNSALSIRHLVPFFFVLFIIGTVVGGFWLHLLWILLAGVLCLHLLIGLYVASKKTRMISEILVMPLLFMSLHVAYGLGYFGGITTIVKKNKGEK